jgi:hypothetical protein
MEDWIKIDFAIGEEPAVFRDALYLPPDHAFSDADIETMKQERYNNWLAVVNSAAEVVVDG